jgi:iron donor protein CyaY
MAMDDQQFRRAADTAIEDLKRALLNAEENADFEVEEQGGVLNLVFEDPPAKFVITPNAPVRQIWISALATSFKLDWSDQQSAFVLLKTGESLKALVSRLVNEQLGEQAVQLG